MGIKGYVVRGVGKASGRERWVQQDDDVFYLVPSRENATMLVTISCAVEVVANVSLDSARIVAVADDGTETLLPSYEEALAQIERIPGLEQANREAHQAIAALKAKIARITIVPPPHDLTPSEVTLAKILAAWDGYEPMQGRGMDEEPPETFDPRDGAHLLIEALGGMLDEAGYVVCDGPTAEGRALLDRARKAGVL
jgi:hypothetical protein